MYRYADGKEIEISKESIAIAPGTCLKNGVFWESGSIIKFFSFIDPNCKVNIVDIGAQIGSYTLYAKFLPHATFYAFEPFKQSYECLVQNVILNGINNVKLFNIALSDTKRDDQKFNVCKSHNGLHTLGETPLRFTDVESHIIETDTIDNIFYNNNIPVHFIKIDTEGWEINVLKGGTKSIMKWRPIIQLELNGVNLKQCNKTVDDLNEMIKSLKYKCTCISGEELIIHPE